jgi:hypothetical protein
MDPTPMSAFCSKLSVEGWNEPGTIQYEMSGYNKWTKEVRQAKH